MHDTVAKPPLPLQVRHWPHWQPKTQSFGVTRCTLCERPFLLTGTYAVLAVFSGSEIVGIACEACTTLQLARGQ